MLSPIIYILGGGLIFGDGVWRTTHFNEQGDAFGALGDRLRVDAAAVLAQQYLDAFLVASGGKGQLRDNPSAPTIASVLKGELVALGVSEERILEESNSNNTYQQLLELVQLRKAHGWQQVDVLTNTWHIPRAVAFLETAKELSTLVDENIRVVSAEEILVAHDREKWEAAIQTAYSDVAMEERYAREEQGIMAIKNGTYVFK